MNYKVYLDYTMELLSKIKIPSYIIDTPFLWDDRYDGELRKTILSDAFLINHKETFQNFINCSGKNNTILLIHDSFACDYIYIKLPDSKKAFFAGPFSFEKFTNQRIDDLCSYNAISAEFALNSSYVSSLFKRETGSTLTNFVNNKRIEHAIYLLNTTKLPIQDIAVQCGITDVNYFTKLFKKIKNMTPSQYREMIQ